MFPPSAMGKWRCPKERACKKKTSASRKCHATKNVALALTVVCENWGLMLTLTILHTQKQGDRRWLGWMVNETVAALKILTENERTESFSNLTLCAPNIWNKTYGRLRPKRLFPFFPPFGDVDLVTQKHYFEMRDKQTFTHTHKLTQYGRPDHNLQLCRKARSTFASMKTKLMPGSSCPLSPEGTDYIKQYVARQEDERWIYSQAKDAFMP